MNQYTLTGVALGVLLAVVSPAQAELYFPPSLISGEISEVADLSRFSTQGTQLPGVYQVDLWLNGERVTGRSVRFNSLPADEQNSETEARDNTGLIACLTLPELLALGVKVQMFPAFSHMDDEQCVSPGRFIPGAYTAFDFQKMRLDINIPQVALANRARGEIPPEQWDDGINAALLNWSFSGSDSRGRYGDSSSHYLNLNSGLNIGPWRLRDSRTWTDYNSTYYRYRKQQHLKTYAERAIIPWRSRLLFGDSTTGSDVFDSLGFRGIQLGTEDSMYPDSLRGFAPVIRGTAASNAELSIRQNGYLVYRTRVAAGAFAITDLYPMYSSGDLNVTVTEADGSTQTFTVPYSSVPLLLREGRAKYEVMAGRYRSSSDSYDDPTFVQATLSWGLPHDFTLYGGAQLSERYRSLALGAGVNMGFWGAISADMTQADSKLADDSRHQGQSLRFLYARSLNEFGTTFQLTGYRYSTRGFYTLDETALKGMSGWLYETDTVDAEGNPIKQSVTDYYSLYNNRRGRLQANISQRLGSLGSLYLTGVRESYWNTSGVTESLQTGFSGRLGKVNYSLTYSLNRNAGISGTDRATFLSLSVPLSSLLPDGSGPVYATASSSRNTSGSTTYQTGLSGTLLEQQNLNWQVSQGHTEGAGNSGNASLNYRGTYGNANLGYSYSDTYRQTSYGLSGGAVLHSEGLTLGQPAGDTAILVAAPGAAGVPLDRGNGVRTDWRGYTIKPYATTYRENRVALDVSQLDATTEIDNAVARVVPTRGAVVKADFKTRSGYRALMTLTHQGKPLPFGAIVSSNAGSGIVGDDGQVYLSGLSPQGTLLAQWGNRSEQKCVANYAIHSGEMPASTLVQRSLQCN